MIGCGRVAQQLVSRALSLAAEPLHHRKPVKLAAISPEWATHDNSPGQMCTGTDPGQHQIEGQRRGGYLMVVISGQRSTMGYYLSDYLTVW
jgi:hypothetical protein